MEKKRLTKEEFNNIKLEDTGLFNSNYTFYDYCKKANIDTIGLLYSINPMGAKENSKEYQKESAKINYNELLGFQDLLNFKYLGIEVYGMGNSSTIDIVNFYTSKLESIEMGKLRLMGFNGIQINNIMKKIKEYCEMQGDVCFTFIDCIKTISTLNSLNIVAPNITDVAKIYVESYENVAKILCLPKPRIIQRDSDIRKELLHEFKEERRDLIAQRNVINSKIHQVKQKSKAIILKKFSKK